MSTARHKLLKAEGMLLLQHRCWDVEEEMNTVTTLCWLGGQPIITASMVFVSSDRTVG